jgi:GTP-binding protein
VDLPGYGFAQAPKDKVERWTRLVNGYLKGRPVLRRVALLIDSRHGLKDSDREMMTMLDKAAVVYQVILTKTDKIKSGELERVMDETREQLSRRVAAYPVVVSTSSEKGWGIADLRVELAELAAP